MPITRVDAVTLIFDGGAPIGGVLDTVGWGRSPYPIRLLIDLDNQTVLLESQFFGMAAGLANLTTNAGDTDVDGLLDNMDNCTDVANPDQADANSDYIGDLCDADISGPGGIEDCQVDNFDLQAVRNAFFSTPGSADWYAPADIDADGHVDFRDLSFVKQQYFGPPGPSAAGCN